MKHSKQFRTIVGFVAAAALSLGASVRANNSPQNLFGIDVSSAQGSINWANVYTNGARFAFAKADEGVSVTDTDFNRNMKRGKNNGLQMGAYHFAYPYANCPSAEANHFWSVAGAYILADGESIFPAVDFDVFSGSACASSYTLWFQDYDLDVKAKTSYFLNCAIIVSACNACYLNSDNGLVPWIVNYNGEDLYTGNPWTTCCTCNAWDTTGKCNSNAWTYWGVTGTGSIGGVSGDCDFDAFNGTLAELKAWQGI